MQNIKRTFLTSALIIVSIFAQAQSISTYSPYSRFGIGQIPTRGFASTKAMGGISQAVRSPYGINYLNPASYSAQDTMSFILDFGFETGATRYESTDYSVKNGFGGIHHIAIAFPVTKWWGSSLGLVPYSQVGYQNMENENRPEILAAIGNVKYYHKGNGGVNQAFFGNAFKPTPNLSIGFNLNYYFGSLNYNNRIEYPNNRPKYFNTSETKSVVLHDLALSFGAQYTAYIDKKNNTFFTIGATFENKTNIKAKSKYLLRYEFNELIDTISYVDSAYNYISFPNSIGLGIAYNYKNKLFSSIEYTTQNWNGKSFLGGTQPITRSNSYRLGFEYIPNRYDLKSYLKRVSYRFGYHFSNTYLKLDGHQINEYAFSTGMGFPFRNNTKFNVAFEWGKRGTTDFGLIKESFGVLSLSLTFYDFWFIKRKFN